MNENALSNLLDDMAKKVEQKRRAKPQPLNGDYRNRLWYEHALKGKTADEAYDIIATNLKNPSFKFESDNALAVYRELYKVPFQSRGEREKLSLEAENAELKRRLAEAEAAKAPVTDKKTDKAIDFSEFPVGMDKEAFKVFFTDWYTKSQGVAPFQAAWGKAWKKYNKEDEVQA